MSTTVPPTRRKSQHVICDCVILAVILVFIGWLIYSVSLAFVSPYLPQFEVESALVSQLNITNGSSSLTATWDISLLARNPNRMYKIDVDSFHPEVQYQYNPDQDIKLGSTQLPAFALKEREDKRLNFKVEVVEESIDDAVAQRISNDMSRGSLRFGVRFNHDNTYSSLPIAVRFYAFLLPFSDDAKIEIVCPQLDFKFPAGNNGTGVLTGQPQCSVLQ